MRRSNRVLPPGSALLLAALLPVASLADVPQRGFAPNLEAIGIRDIQQQLRAHGYDPGPDSGTMNDTTRIAILAYQHDYGLREDGTAGPALENMLHFLRRRPVPPAPPAADNGPVTVPPPLAALPPQVPPAAPPPASVSLYSPPPAAMPSPPDAMPPAPTAFYSAPPAVIAPPAPVAPDPAPVAEAAPPAIPPEAPPEAQAQPDPAPITEVPEQTADAPPDPAPLPAEAQFAAPTPPAPPPAPPPWPPSTLAEDAPPVPPAALIADLGNSTPPPPRPAIAALGSLAPPPPPPAPPRPAQAESPALPDPLAATAIDLPATSFVRVPDPLAALAIEMPVGVPPAPPPVAVLTLAKTPKMSSNEPLPVAEPRIPVASGPLGTDPAHPNPPPAFVPPPFSTAPTRMDADEPSGDAYVREVQGYLKELGFFGGPADGVLDWPTVEALVKFDASGTGPSSVIANPKHLDEVWIARLKTAIAAKSAGQGPPTSP